MRRSLYSGAGLMMGLLLAGCSGVAEAPKRETKPVQATYTVKVPGMT